MNEEKLVEIAIQELRQLAPGISGQILFTALGFILPTLHEMLDSLESDARATLQLKGLHALRGLGMI
jgi:hypothetical protein